MKTGSNSFPLALGALVALAASPAMALPPCNADLDGNGWVDQADLGILLASYGVDAGGDINGDGVTDQIDLGILLSEYGMRVSHDFGAEYDNAEAWQIGLEMLGSMGPLNLPLQLYERIDRDLALIRAFDGVLHDLDNQPHTEAWIPNQMIVRLWDDGDEQEYACANEYYQVINEWLIFPSLNMWELTMAGNINVPALTLIYEQLDLVRNAWTNDILGGDDINTYTPTNMGGGVWRWHIDDGFYDCWDGCDCHHYYVFDVDADGVVTLISYQQVGPWYCPWPW